MIIAKGIVLLSKTKAGLGRKHSMCKRALENRGFKIKRTKTKYLTFNTDEIGDEIKMNKVIKKVAGLKYFVCNR